MDSDPIGERLRTFIQTEIIGDPGASPPGNDDALLERGIIDSMGLFRLVSFIEQEFGVALPDTSLVPKNFSSVSSIIRLVREHQK